MNKHAMIDIECAAKPKNGDYNCVVLSIGIVPFDHTGVQEDKGQHLKLDIVQQLLIGLRTDHDTCLWWSKQDVEAIKAAWGYDDELEVKHALRDLSAMIGPQTKVWSKGSTFDICILQALYERFDVKVPWHFRNIMCMRNLGEFVDKSKIREKNSSKHDALSDAITQAKEVYNAKVLAGVWVSKETPSTAAKEIEFLEALRKVGLKKEGDRLSIDLGGLK